MALIVPEGRTHTDAAIACLEAAGLTVGDASGSNLAKPYLVIYGDQGTLDGPMGDRFADLNQTLTVHGVGDGPQQAQWVGDKARAALLSTPVDVTDRAVLYLTHLTTVPIQRDDSIQPPIFYTVDQYALATTPA